jgi:6,7-dimethyl-8-ribityllumazine synthase
MKTIQGNLSASEFRFAIILSRFNEFIGNRLLDGSVRCLKKYGCGENNIDIYKVPGAFEIPVTAEKLIASGKYNAIICLGAVIRGGTPHFDYVAGGVSNGIMQVSLKNSFPVIFGVLTTDTYEQALERSEYNAGQSEGITDILPENKEPGSGNKGWDAALTAIEMASLFALLK